MYQPFRYPSALALGLILLLQVGPAPAQPPGQDQPRERPLMGIYDLQTVETVSGIVLSVIGLSVTPPKSKLPELVYLTLKTEREKLTVYLGPSIFINKLPVQVKELDQIEVTGSRISLDGKPILMAATIKKGNQVIKLRDENGTPIWSRRGWK